MTCINFPISFPGLKITEVHKQEDQVEIIAVSTQIQAVCPNCGICSTSVHSYYKRSPADFPISAYRVRLHLTVKRFSAVRPRSCSATFVEGFPHLLEKYSPYRSSASGSGRHCLCIGWTSRQSPGPEASHASQRGDLLLRMIRGAPTQLSEEAEIIGVDDWAKRCGRVYGTILVDLERHRVIDLLTDRTGQRILAQWLRSHPDVKIVARDRSMEYARGISEGAPQAIQVADRWHLLVNLREACKAGSHSPQLDIRYLPAPHQNRMKSPFSVSSRSKETEIARQARQQQRQALHAEIHRLRNKGFPLRTIAHRLGEFPPRSTNTWLCQNSPKDSLANECLASSIRIVIISVSAGKRAVEMHASCGVKSGN